MLGIAGVALAGCSTTQETAARLQLQSYREIAAENATAVHRTSSTVTTGRVSLVSSGDRTAYVVDVHNASDHAVSDLPISVGYVRGHRTAYANASETLDYFASHLGLIAAHSTVTWVFVGRRVGSGAHAFARVGTRAPADISATPKSSSDAFRFGVSTTARACRCLTVTLTNQSGVPQFDLPVYVYGRRGGGVDAAGAATVSTLDSGARRTVTVPLVGATGGQLHVEVLPADAR